MIVCVCVGRLFGGLIHDIKLKAKWYVSDLKDGLHVQCIAAFFFMYFACLTPIVTFGGLLGAATDDFIVRVLLPPFIPHNFQLGEFHCKLVFYRVFVRVGLQGAAK